MKKHVKLAGLVVIALIFLGTFVFLYQKSQPQVKRYEIHTPQLCNIEKATLVTGSIEPRDEVNIKNQISGIITELYKQPG